MKTIPLLALAALPLLSACSASVTTFSGKLTSTPGGRDAQAYCTAEVEGRGTTREISVPGTGPSIYQQQMKICLNRYGYEPDGY